MSNFLRLLAIVLPALGATPGYAACRLETGEPAGVENPPHIVIVADGAGDILAEARHGQGAVEGIQP